MTTVYLCPTFGVGYQSFLSTGLPNNGGFIYTYQAGTSSAESTYTTSAGSVQNANPIVLGADGRPASEIWLVSGVAYKFVVKDSLGNILGTFDNISGINDTAASGLSEWVNTNLTPTYVSATSFTLAGNQTGTIAQNGRLKTINTGGTIYSTVSSSTYSAGTGLTTVVVVNDSGSLDSGISSVYYGFLNPTNPSVPAEYLRAGLTATGAILQTKGSNIASGSTVDLSLATGNEVHITGSTGPITSFGTVNAGAEFTLIFDSTPSITYNGTSMILNTGGANYQCVAGDRARVVSEGSGNWAVNITPVNSATPAAIQAQSFTRFTAGGTADAITGTLTPAPTLANGLVVSCYPPGANTLTAPTLNVNSLGAKKIFKRDSSGSAVALVAGDYNASGPFRFEYNTVLDTGSGGWVLLDAGVNWASPGAIGGTTPNTSVFSQIENRGAGLMGDATYHRRADIGKAFSVGPSASADVATCKFSDNYSVGIIVVEAAAVGGTGNFLYCRAIRAVSMTGDSPVFTTLGTDALQNCTIAFSYVATHGFKATITNTVADTKSGSAWMSVTGGGADGADGGILSLT